MNWKNLTTEQKLEDFRYLFQAFKDNHGKLAMIKRMYGYDWVAHEKEFEEEVRKTKDDREFAYVIDKILDSLNDGHTWLVSPAEWTVYCTNPLFYHLTRKVPAEAVTYWYELASGRPRDYRVFPALYFEGEYVVVVDVTLEDCRAKPGWVVTRVNDIEVDNFVVQQGKHLRYDPVRRKPYSPILGLPISGKVKLTFRNASGTYVEGEVVSSYETWPARRYRPPYYSNEDGTWIDDSLFLSVIPGVAGYMHFCRMSSFDEEDLTSVKEFLASVKDLPALIIDVRGNPGGYVSAWQKLVMLLASEPVRYQCHFAPRSGSYVRKLFPRYFEVEKPDFAQEDPELARVLPPEVLTADFHSPFTESTKLLPDPNSLKYAGKIFVLTDYDTYSAADSLAYFSKQTKWATVIGTFTDGGGNGPYATLMPLVLPNSRMLVLFPFALALEPDGRSYEESSRMPDVYVADRETFVKYVNALNNGEKLKSLDPEYDAVLRECLKIIKHSTIPR
ncbi:MAG: hypothetical protein IMW97_05535 [Firmicutes bacterium]|nr:hypothetical protein [Candidatus Fermentithermobacillaceae bacterium]